MHADTCRQFGSSIESQPCRNTRSRGCPVTELTMMSWRRRASCWIASSSMPSIYLARDAHSYINRTKQTYLQTIPHMKSPKSAIITLALVGAGFTAGSQTAAREKNCRREESSCPARCEARTDRDRYRKHRGDCRRHAERLRRQRRHVQPGWN